MSRMSKKRKQEWSFFLNDCNRITYNALCRKCVHECKQSFRAIVIECPLLLLQTLQRWTQRRTSSSTNGQAPVMDYPAKGSDE